MIWVVTSAKMLLKLYREVLLFSIGAVYGLLDCSYSIYDWDSVRLAVAILVLR